MSGREQGSLGRFAPSSVFDDIRDLIGDLRGEVINTLERFDLDWWGKSPFSLDTDKDVHVYQYVLAYSNGTQADGYDFSKSKGARPTNRGSPSPEVQFKVGIYTLGPVSSEIKERFRQTDVFRLIKAYDSREYEGRMSGFGFQDRDEYVQDETVSAREADDKGYGLGVPWFEVEAYNEDGGLEGYSDGYFNPFDTDTRTRTVEMGEDPPQHEVWKLGGRQEAKGRYQIAPEAGTPARERAKRAGEAGKVAVINGQPVGRIHKRGRVLMNIEYEAPERATYTSREQIIERTGTPYQALSEGSNLYKVKETDDSLIFSTTRPERDYDPVEAETVSPTAIGREVREEEETTILIDDELPTEFHIETDENDGRLLGLYDPPVTRLIEEGRRLVF